MTPTTIFSTSKVFKTYLLNALMKEGEARTRRPTNASSKGHGLGFAHIVLPVNWIAHKASTCAGHPHSPYWHWCGPDYWQSQGR